MIDMKHLFFKGDEEYDLLVYNNYDAETFIKELTRNSKIIEIIAYTCASCNDKKYIKEAVKCLLKATEFGKFDGLEYIGTIIVSNEEYRDVFGSKAKILKNVFWLFKISAEHGIEDCLRALGYAYSNGIGTKQNLNKAIECFKKIKEMSLKF